MPERMTVEEAKIQRAIEAARIAKQTLLEENRDRMPLEVEEDLVKVKRPKAENVTIKVPNQKKEGYGLAGVENEYKIKKQEPRVRGIVEDIDGILNGIQKVKDQYASDNNQKALMSMMQDLSDIARMYK